jgi:hypothetical protein
MSRLTAILALSLSPVLFVPAVVAASPQTSTTTVVAAESAPSGSATLKICLRGQDDSPFSGATNLRVRSSQGLEIPEAKSELEGETLYPDLPPGTYSIEASAPGFARVTETVDIESGKRTQTLFLILKPEAPLGGANPSSAAAASTAPDSARPDANLLWIPPGVDAYVPRVASGVSCALPRVLEGAGERTKQLVTNLQKFSATEHLEHYPVDYTGKRLSPLTRTFDYVAVVTLNPGGMFSIDEYRNGSVDRTRFPANVATEGLPAMALIFHPVLASDFNFVCEGLGNWGGRPAWQVHFVQRTDRPNRFGGYRTQQHYYPFDYKGRAWIDAGTYQVLRLEFELAKPIRAVGLTQQLEFINYASVSFHTRRQQLWLPQSAEMYLERRGQRFYRSHTFTDFKIFAVDTDQNIRAPKQSYCFTNTTDRDIAGVLTVSPASGISLKAVSIRFTIPPGQSIYKVVGPGKDISMPADEVGSATLTHNGPAGSVKADAYLVRESTLDVIADSSVSISP